MRRSPLSLSIDCSCQKAGPAGLRAARFLRDSLTLVALLALAACGNPSPTNPVDGGAGDSSSASDAGVCAAAAYTENVTACTPLSTDYQPRQMMPGSNGWPTCISDDNTWHLIGTGLPAAAARSMAFESMGTRLWNRGGAPSQEDFLAARDDYSVMEGLASRIARRQDVHYTEVPGGDKFACSDPTIAAMYPDRCAGPAKLKPIIDDAFVQGTNQQQPLVQAARLEASLLWFFYLSMTSEVWTCSFDDMTDCDSAAGYYTQVSPRDMPAGLARYVASLGPETHQRIHDALLAERCWRDIDNQLPAQPQFLQYYDLALAQLDRATLRGMALILRQRIGRIQCETGEAQLAQIEVVKILGGLLDRAATALDATRAAQLRTFTAAPTADPTAATSAQTAIDAIFTCP